MEKINIEHAISAIVEELAGVEHERWAHWQEYMHSKGARQQDGSLLIPAALVEKWDRQIVTPYSELTEIEKESDRDQVRKYIPLITDAIAKAL